MSDALLAGVALAPVRERLVRNIVSIAVSQDLFDDLSAQPRDWAAAQAIESEIKPPPYRSASPIIDRPFEDAAWNNAIAWPFRHWQASRYSDGTFGVWYGCDSAETSVFETAYHWYHGLLGDAGFEHEDVIAERRLYGVACDAALLDLRPQLKKFPALLHKTDYGFCQAIGARLRREGHPGLVTRSVRHAAGTNYAVLNAAVLSAPKMLGQLRYRLQGGRIRVEKQRGRAWFTLDAAAL